MIIEKNNQLLIDYCIKNFYAILMQIFVIFNKKFN